MLNVKQLLGSVMVCGVLLTGCGASDDVQVEEPKTVEVQKPQVNSYNDLVKAIEWNIVTDEYGDTTATGLLTNTTDKEIEYIEIEYKFIKDGITVDSSWTNATNIAPNETVQVEIYTFKEFDTMQVKDSEADVDEWIVIETMIEVQEPVTEVPEVIEEEIVEETPVEEVEVEGNFTQLDESTILFNGYAGDFLKLLEAEDKEAVTVLMGMAMNSAMYTDVEYTLLDKDGKVLVIYLGGEAVNELFN